MRCQHCKGSISVVNFVKEKSCPSCNGKLKQMPTKEQAREFLVSFAEDKGYIFWAVVYIVIIWVVAFFEQILGQGTVFDYITQHNFRFIILAAFAGSIIDYYAKANVEVTGIRNKFLFRPPIYLRRFRYWTNFGLVGGLIASWYIQHRYPNYFSHIMVYTMIPSFLICFFWAVMGVFLSADDMKDKRIIYFMNEMRVERHHKLNRASVIYVSGFFISTILYYWLVNISGLWFYISNSRFVYNILTFFKMYFGWVKTFVD